MSRAIALWEFVGGGGEAGAERETERKQEHEGKRGTGGADSNLLLRGRLAIETRTPFELDQRHLQHRRAPYTTLLPCFTLRFLEQPSHPGHLVAATIYSSYTSGKKRPRSRVRQPILCSWSIINISYSTDSSRYGRSKATSASQFNNPK